MSVRAVLRLTAWIAVALLGLILVAQITVAPLWAGSWLTRWLDDRLSDRHVAVESLTIDRLTPSRAVLRNARIGPEARNADRGQAEADADESAPDLTGRPTQRLSDADRPPGTLTIPRAEVDWRFTAAGFGLRRIVLESPRLTLRRGSAGFGWPFPAPTAEPRETPNSSQLTRTLGRVLDGIRTFGPDTAVIRAAEIQLVEATDPSAAPEAPDPWHVDLFASARGAGHVAPPDQGPAAALVVRHAADRFGLRATVAEAVTDAAVTDTAAPRHAAPTESPTANQARPRQGSAGSRRPQAFAGRIEFDWSRWAEPIVDAIFDVRVGTEPEPDAATTIAIDARPFSWRWRLAGEWLWGDASTFRARWVDGRTASLDVHATASLGPGSRPLDPTPENLSAANPTRSPPATTKARGTTEAAAGSRRAANAAPADTDSSTAPPEAPPGDRSRFAAHLALRAERLADTRRTAPSQPQLAGAARAAAWRTTASLHQAAFSAPGAGSVEGLELDLVTETPTAAWLDPTAVRNCTGRLRIARAANADDSLQALDTEAEFRLVDRTRVALDRLRFRAGKGGVFTVRPTTWQIGTTAIDLVVDVEDLPLATWLEFLGRDKVEGSGQLAGTLRVRLAWERTLTIRLRRSHLVSNGGGTLRIEDSDAARKVLAEQLGHTKSGDVQYDQLLQQRIFGSLRNFAYEELTFDIAPLDGPLALQVQLRGRGRDVPQELDMTVNFRNIQDAVDFALQMKLGWDRAREGAQPNEPARPNTPPPGSLLESDR